VFFTHRDDGTPFFLYSWPRGNGVIYIVETRRRESSYYKKSSRDNRRWVMLVDTICTVVTCIVERIPVFIQFPWSHPLLATFFAIPLLLPASNPF
jgi:hypothetical protein